MSNLKIDIIYYKTSSDFEMEFNLSGCCRMRMFKDKVESPKGLVNTLARDVSRSKIIIVVTDLFGENNGVSIISRAIKLPMSLVNKSDFGIKTTDEVMIPETAVPLVTKSGIYGGCIIESGPQSIIIVSSMRALRHEIMKAYVHNYIFDVAQLLAYQERMGSGNGAIPTVPSAPVVEKKEEPLSEQPLEESASVENVAPEESVPEAVVEDTNESSYLAVPPGINSTSEIELPEETEIPEAKESAPRRKKRRSKASNIILLIIVILLLVGFGILAYYFVYLPLLEQPGIFTDGEPNAITEFLSGLFA